MVNERRSFWQGLLYRASHTHKVVEDTISQIRAAREAEEAKTPIIAEQTLMLVREKEANHLTARLTAGFEARIPRA